MEMERGSMGSGAALSDYIRITGLKLYAYHGVFEEEKKRGQEFVINAKLYYDMREAARTDKLEYALDYARCCQVMAEAFTEKSFDLIEAAAHYVCIRLLSVFALLQRAEVEVCKPHAPVELPFENISVTVVREWHLAYLSVGSNMGDSLKIIGDGLEELKKNPAIRNPVMSDVIVTEPYGGVKQDDFYNACIRISTLLTPEELLGALHEVESHAGRVRDIRWGPRTLDLDILFYDKWIYESEDLVIPHVDMQNRFFVLKPLAQLCPNYRHPILNKTVNCLLAELGTENARGTADDTGNPAAAWQNPETER